jgi:indolepyruvate ferredoxin oxidoreductase alpha subunit
METTMGGCISFLSGAVEAYKRSGRELPFKAIAYVGDSDFFHSAFSGICEAVSKNHPILMILMDNQGAVSTGKQAHLGMPIKEGITQISIRKLLEAMGIKNLFEVSVSNRDSLYEKLLDGVKSNEFYCLIVHTEF